jgi:hypothetical protein
VLAILHASDTFHGFLCTLGEGKGKKIKGILVTPTCISPSSQQGQKKHPSRDRLLLLIALSTVLPPFPKTEKKIVKGEKIRRKMKC